MAAAEIWDLLQSCEREKASHQASKMSTEYTHERKIIHYLSVFYFGLMRQSFMSVLVFAKGNLHYEWSHFQMSNYNVYMSQLSAIKNIKVVIFYLVTTVKIFEWSKSDCKVT